MPGNAGRYLKMDFSSTGIAQLEIIPGHTLHMTRNINTLSIIEVPKLSQ
jgi:hypothetical protein